MMENYGKYNKFYCNETIICAYVLVFLYVIFDQIMFHTVVNFSAVNYQEV